MVLLRRLSGQRHLQPLDLTLEAADPREGCEERLDLLGLGLPALGKQDDLVEVDLSVPDLIHEGQKLARDHGNTREGAAELDLTDLDAPAEAHFLLRREQMDLADFLEVQANGVLSRTRAGTEGVGRECGSFLEDDGLFFLLEIDPDGSASTLGSAPLRRRDFGREDGAPEWLVSSVAESLVSLKVMASVLLAVLDAYG